MTNETDEQEQLDVSRNIISGSIKRIKAENSTKDITVQDILFDLSDQGVIKKGTQGFKNKHLHDNLVAMRDQGVTAEEIIKATKTDTDWDKLIGTVKKTELQRQLVQDSIKKIRFFSRLSGISISQGF